MTNTKKGFISILFSIVAVILILALSGYFIFGRKETDTESDEARVTITDESEEQILPSNTAAPTASQKQKTQVTNSPTSVPSPITTDSVCLYSFEKPVGSVKVNIKSQSSEAIGEQSIELSAKSGCRVLSGKTQEKETKFTNSGSSVDFGNIPPGSYTVRSYYKNSWSEYHTITVVSGQQTTVTVTVNVTP